MMATAAAKPSVVTAVRPSPGVDIAPPVTPNLVRTPEVASARKVGESAIETLLFRFFRPRHSTGGDDWKEERDRDEPLHRPLPS